MKKFLAYFLYTLLLSAIACACSDNIDIKQDYEFEVTHLPVQSKITEGETAEIRFQLIRSGYWEDTKFYMRYFQSSGKGELRTADGMVFLPNDLYEIQEETFLLYYTSESTDQQIIDLYFSDSFGNTFTLSFSFSNESNSEEDRGKED